MKKDVFLLFDTACIYEIVCLNYFLKFTGSETIFCSVRGSDITSMEGYRIGIDCKISDIELSISEVWLFQVEMLAICETKRYIAFSGRQRKEMYHRWYLRWGRYPGWIRYIKQYSIYSFDRCWLHRRQKYCDFKGKWICRFCDWNG